MNVFQVKHLNVSYHKDRVLEDISFDVLKKDFLAIFGQNGSGKSTLIKALLGLLPLESGDIKAFGKKLDSNIKGKIGYLPQKTQFADSKFPATAYEVIASGILTKKKKPKKVNDSDKKIIDRYLELLGIEDVKYRQIGNLSGGQQQRVLLARAMVSSPSILVLDEPTASLDPESRKRFYELLKKLNEKEDITILIISHDSIDIINYVNKVLCLDKNLIYFGDAKGYHFHGSNTHFLK